MAFMFLGALGEQGGRTSEVPPQASVVKPCSPSASRLDPLGATLSRRPQGRAPLLLAAVSVFAPLGYALVVLAEAVA